MTDTPLNQLEDLTGFPLPSEYVSLLNDYPNVLAGASRSIDDSEFAGTVAEFELIANPNLILSLNLEVRSDSVLDPAGQDFFWPNQLVVIGETGEGDYYCIDASEEHAGVFLFDHQAVEFEVMAESLQEFVDALIESFTALPS